MTRHFLTGIERGMYENDNITLHDDCFGPKYVTKINEFSAMIKEDVWKNWILEISVIYQIYYMWGEKCTTEFVINDLFKFCWNEGCSPLELANRSGQNWLYMLRDINDAAIVWYEGIPENYDEDLA